jgi:hypothetical protein
MKKLGSTAKYIYAIVALIILAEPTIILLSGYLKSAQAEAFNEGRLRQCTYTFGCDMKALKSELFDQQRKQKLGLTKP